MFIILSLFIICALFVYGIETTQNESQKRYLIWVCLGFMTIVSGTRLCGGLDFPTYEDHYQQLATFPDVLNPVNVNQNYEIGYTYIASFFKTVGISFYGFCLIHAAFFFFCLWKGLSRYTNHFGIVILVFLYKLFFYNTMISMRQSITIALFFVLLPLIENKKFLRYYICVFFVSKIHNGSFLLYALYPLIYITLDKGRIRWLNLIFIPTIAIGMAGIDVMGPIGLFLQDNAANEAIGSKASKYFENENMSPIGIFHTLEYFLVMFLFYKNIHHFDLKDSKTHLVVWMFLCLLPLFTLLRGSEILTREKDYFVIFYAVIIGMLIDRIPQKKSLLYIGITLLCAFGYYRYVISFDGGHFLTYTSWMFDHHYSFFSN